MSEQKELPPSFVLQLDAEVLDGRVRTPSGTVLDAGTVQRIAEAPPANTRRSRASRVAAFVTWCRSRGRIATDPGAAPDWASHLADLLHPADTITAYTTAVASELAVSGRPLSAEDRAYLRTVIQHRAREEAGEPDDAGDALQATEVTRADLRAMVATLDLTTVRGLRDRLTLVLAWYMTARASEPGTLNSTDVREELAEWTDLDTGEQMRMPALVARLRLSKTNPYGKAVDVVRILEQADELVCPVAACRDWRAALARIGEEGPGPLLRSVDRWDRPARHGHQPPGRPPADPRRAAGIGDRTVRNIIARTARDAGLSRPLTAEELGTLSKAAEEQAVAAAAEEDREAIRGAWRRRRRALRRELPRYSGHSMRRGGVRDMQRRNVPRHIIERQARYVPGSRALARYLDDLVAWQDNPTRPGTR